MKYEGARGFVLMHTTFVFSHCTVLYCLSCVCECVCTLCVCVCECVRTVCVCVCVCAHCVCVCVCAVYVMCVGVMCSCSGFTVCADHATTKSGNVDSSC